MARPVMEPSPGDAKVRHVGDHLRVALHLPGQDLHGWKAFLRTNLTRGARAREEVLALAGRSPREPRTFAGAAWRDLPMAAREGGWSLALPLAEVGWFRAKAYCLDPEGRQHWPEGGDLGLSVLPDGLRGGNVIYCAFPRLFGSTTPPEPMPACVEALDRGGWTALPPSGKLRDLTAQVPHIFDRLGCRILHLLPVAPTPTTYARFGRYGSPYAALDLTAIDPALVAFDGRTTAEDQFRELADAVHGRGGLLLLDLVAHHTGWGSRLMEQHPDWFRREPDGRFRNPGAWGVVWGDLVEVDDHHPPFWELLADALLTWCRRGVDGFRCDAGYMVPLAAWQFIQARARGDFPDTVFLLEGLGGAWELTESLLTEGGMQWAYSELFQNHRGDQASGYLDHAFRQAERLGPLVHYSETHDNDRLAARGSRCARMRHRLCALASTSGAFGYTCGAEWLATEKIDVHGRADLAWGREPNLVRELGDLARLLSEHPCFQDGAALRRLSPPGAQVLAVERAAADGLDHCLVLVNLDPDAPGSLELEGEAGALLAACRAELLGQAPPRLQREGSAVRVDLGPGDAFCLAPHPEPRGLHGRTYRHLRACSAWGLQQLAAALPQERVGDYDWRALGRLVAEDPEGFLAALGRLRWVDLDAGLLPALEAAKAQAAYPAVRRWEAPDASRVLPLPPGHPLLIRDAHPFRVAIRGEGLDWQAASLAAGGAHVAALPPRRHRGRMDAEVEFRRLDGSGAVIRGRIRLLAPGPGLEPEALEGLVLLTNGRGAMARLQADLGQARSKYDCLLGANLDPAAPCDRLVLAARARVWVNADGFLTPLDAANLESLSPGPPARWRFHANAGDGRRVALTLDAAMVPGWNAVALRFHRRPGDGGPPVSLTVRLDLEHRGFHEETRDLEALEARFGAGTLPLADRPGFRFAPAEGHGLRAWSSAGTYHPEPEGCADLRYPAEAERGLASTGAAWSPGWFELPLAPDEAVEVRLCADEAEPPEARFLGPPPRSFEARLRAAARAFLAARDGGLTVIAGFPWFLDWGRDAALAARGLLTGGLRAEGLGVLATLASNLADGALPNRLGTEDRATSDAPLWFALACEEAGPELLDAPLARGPTGWERLLELGRAHLRGTASGVRMDPGSALLWSPARHTWMDTGHPACTPREGYPVEIQALWIRLLRHLARIEGAGPWPELAARAGASLGRYWIEEHGWFADSLEAGPGVPASEAWVDPRFRPNQLLAVTLGIASGDRARRAVDATTRHLLVPGGLRSLSPAPADTSALRSDVFPYAGRYEGDEDTRRKPAYHNGTAWVWLLPVYAEALARAWDFDRAAVKAARALVADLETLLDRDCLGQLPELLDGDAPHAGRGCDAQAWSATEALRVWRLLESGS